MTSELAVINEPLSAMEVRAQVNLIQEVMQSVMKDGTHFGKIPGAGEKPTLFKAGAEKLASTFRLAVEPIVEELSHGDEYRIRIIARITEMGTERFLGSGVGEASSSESKYMWRAAVCPEEWEATPESQRREKWNKGYQNKPAWSQKQVRMNVADVANTVLKMAKKRAMVDGILTVTGASDIFTQDIEELPKEYLDQKVTPASVMQQPSRAVNVMDDHDPGDPTPVGVISHQSSEPQIRPKSQKGTPQPQQTQQAPPEPSQPQQTQGQVVGAEPVITEKQARMLFAISKSANLSDQDVKDTLAGIGLRCHRDEIPKSRFQDVLTAIDPEFRFHANK
jgi:hypothetical protein